jgi:hypothetical protein
MSLLWLLIPEFTDYQASPEIVAASTAFIMAVVGYFKKEKRFGWSS